jgi:FkbM family methyltransferase
MVDQLFEYPEMDVKYLLPDDAETATHLHTVMKELYREREYSALDVKGKTVLDIGAFLGETAVFFSRNGAGRVIAVEPMATFEYIGRNMGINNVTNATVTRGYVGTELPGIDLSFINNGGSKIRAGKDAVRHYTLKELIKEFAVEKGSVMKIDAEGGEYQFFAEASDEDLMQFSQIAAEIHWSPQNNKDMPAQRLYACGFDVHMTRHYRETWDLVAKAMQ